MNASRYGRTQLARNALSGPARYAIAAVLGLVVTPYALHVLGRDRFGVWALAGVVLAVLQLLDLGLLRSVTRAVADAVGRGDTVSAAPDVSAGRGGAAAIALVSAVAVWLLRDTLVVDLFHVPAELRADATYVIVGTAIVAGAQLLFAPFQASLDGLGRMDLSSGIDAVQRIASSLGVALVLALGWGLQGLVWKNLATALAAGVAYWRVARREAPDLLSGHPRLDIARLRRLIAFGRHVQIVNAGAALIEPLSKTILARTTGIDAVALFDLAWRIVGMLSSGFLSATAALFPAAASSRSSSGASEDAARHLYARSADYLSWLATPAYFTAIALSGSFAATWLGPGYDSVARLIAILALGWLPAVLSVPAFLIAQATGRERLSTWASLATAGVSLGAAAGLARAYGLAGVAAGVAIGLGAGAVAIQVLFGRSLGDRRLLVPVRMPVLVSAALGGAAAWAVAAAGTGGWWLLAAAACVGAAAYGAAMYVSGAARPNDVVELWLILRGDRSGEG